MDRECRARFPHHWLQRKPLVSDPSMHHGTCVTHVPWCMSGSFTRSGGEDNPGIPGTCATRNFAYLARGPRTNDTLWDLRWILERYPILLLPSGFALSVWSRCGPDLESHIKGFARSVPCYWQIHNICCWHKCDAYSIEPTILQQCAI